MTTSERAKQIVHEFLLAMPMDDGRKAQQLLYEKVRDGLEATQKDLLLMIECHRCCGIEFQARKVFET